MAEGLTEVDMAAAKQLMHLSSGEEDEGGRYACRNNIYLGDAKNNDKRLSRPRRYNINIKEDEDEDEDDRDERLEMRKRQRFLPLVYIYKVTKPVAIS